MRRLCMLAWLVGCGSSKTPFPPGLAPLEDNRAEWPAEGAETLSLRLGESDDDGGYTWGHGRAYVQQPVERVLDALTTPRVTVNRRKVTAYTVEWDVEPEYTWSYVIHNTVDDVITLEYDLTWRHGVVEGSEEAPSAVGTRWQKTDGSDVIELQRGSVYSWAVDEETTALEFVLHQRSISDDRAIVSANLDDFFVDIRAASHGEELPSYVTGL